MLSWIFHSAGMQPSFLIGGIAENFGSSFQLGQGKHFILEGDEYDTAFFDKGPKFLHYFPDSVILTSVEFDHADIYKDLDAVETAFKRLVNLVPRRGRIVAFDRGREPGALPGQRFLPGRTLWRERRLRIGESQTCGLEPRHTSLVSAFTMANLGRISSLLWPANTTSGMPLQPRPWLRGAEFRKKLLQPR